MKQFKIFFSVTLLFFLFFFINSNKNKILKFLFKKESIETVIEKLKGKENLFLESYPNLYEIKHVVLIAIKEEQILEVWTKTSEKEKYTLQKKYPFTATSGGLGLKLKSGDRQIPEGVYKLISLNPNSSYHLSIKLSYPNEMDLKWAEKENRTDLGGDIFIHGKSVSIGCIPIGDENIEELFYLVNHVQLVNTEIWILPVDFRKNKTYLGDTESEKEVYHLLKKKLDEL